MRIAREVPETLVWVLVFDTPYEVSNIHCRDTLLRLSPTSQICAERLRSSEST